jgi:hypothetical protein
MSAALRIQLMLLARKNLAPGSNTPTSKAVVVSFRPASISGRREDDALKHHRAHS